MAETPQISLCLYNCFVCVCEEAGGFGGYCTHFLACYTYFRRPTVGEGSTSLSMSQCVQQDGDVTRCSGVCARVRLCQCLFQGLFIGSLQALFRVHLQINVRARTPCWLASCIHYFHVSALTSVCVLPLCSAHLVSSQVASCHVQVRLTQDASCSTQTAQLIASPSDRRYRSTAICFNCTE